MMGVCDFLQLLQIGDLLLVELAAQFVVLHLHFEAAATAGGLGLWVGLELLEKMRFLR